MKIAERKCKTCTLLIPAPIAAKNPRISTNAPIPQTASDTKTQTESKTNMQQTDKAVEQKEWNDLGIIIDGAYDSADYINKATAELAERFGFDFDAPNVDDEDEDHGQIWSEIGDSAVNYLNDNLTLPSYCSFYFEDNSLFCSPSIESAREDVEFVSSKRNEYPSDDYEGEWLHVNDHGNATLYVRNDKGEDNEIWSLV